MRTSLNLEDLAVESVVIDPDSDASYVASDPWYTNTRPIPASNTACTACWA